MILKHITVQNLGSVDRFEQDFRDRLTLVKSRYTEEISHAIRLVLNHKAPPLLGSRAEGSPRIEAVVEVPPKTFRLVVSGESDQHDLCLRAYDACGNDVTEEYLYLTAHCAEHDLSDVFQGDRDTPVFRPLQYIDADRYDQIQELATHTDGMSKIKAFRKYLLTFIKNFRPEQIREGKRYELCLDSNGKYAVRYIDDHDMPVFLSESEQRLLRYLCFLKTAEFWNGFESLRNLNDVKKPLLVEHFLERLDESIDVQELWNRTLKLRRQLIILTL